MLLGGMGITPSPLGEHFSIIFELITDEACTVYMI